MTDASTLWRRAEDAFLALFGKVAPGDQVVMANVEAVYADGRVKVLGAIVPVSGRAHVLPGQRVAVLLRRGTPRLVFAHSARRAKSHTTFPLVGGVVEQLFVAGELGARHVYWRNYSTVVRLDGVRAALGADPVGVKWATVDHAFVAWTENNRVSGEVESADYVYSVFTLNRPAAGKPFARGATPTATHAATYDLKALSITLTTISYTKAYTSGTQARILRRDQSSEEGSTATWDCGRLETGEEIYNETGSAVATWAGALFGIGSEFPDSPANGRVLDVLLRPAPGLPGQWDLLVLAGIFPDTIATTWTRSRDYWRTGVGPTEGVVMDTETTSGTLSKTLAGNTVPFLVNARTAELLVRGWAPTYTFVDDYQDGGMSGPTVWVEAFLDGDLIVKQQMTLVGAGSVEITCDAATITPGSTGDETSLCYLDDADYCPYLATPLYATAAGEATVTSHRRYRSSTFLEHAQIDVDVESPDFPTIAGARYLRQGRIAGWGETEESRRLLMWIGWFPGMNPGPGGLSSSGEYTRPMVLDEELAPVHELMDWVFSSYADPSFPRNGDVIPWSLSRRHAMWFQDHGGTTPAGSGDWGAAPVMEVWTADLETGAAVPVENPPMEVRERRWLAVAPDLLYQAEEGEQEFLTGWEASGPVQAPSSASTPSKRAAGLADLGDLEPVPTMAIDGAREEAPDEDEEADPRRDYLYPPAYSAEYQTVGAG